MTPAPATQAEARNFRLEVADGIATVLIDEPGEPVNTLSDEVGEEFDRILSGLGKDPSVKAVVFGSGKKDGFIAGAKIEMLQAVKTAAAAEKLSRDGQAGFDRLERFPKPVVAAIHGACLGGGLEFRVRKVALVMEEGQEPSDFLLVSVFNSGPPISKAELPLIFDRYRNVLSENKDSHTAGLGLIICQRIIDAHNGKIWVESE